MLNGSVQTKFNAIDLFYNNALSGFHGPLYVQLIFSVTNIVTVSIPCRIVLYRDMYIYNRATANTHDNQLQIVTV